MISKSSYDFLMDTNVIVSDLFYRMTGLSHICICCFKSVLIFFHPAQAQSAFLQLGE